MMNERAVHVAVRGRTPRARPPPSFHLSDSIGLSLVRVNRVGRRHGAVCQTQLRHGCFFNFEAFPLFYLSLAHLALPSRMLQRETNDSAEVGATSSVVVSLPHRPSLRRSSLNFPRVRLVRAMPRLHNLRQIDRSGAAKGAALSARKNGAASEGGGPTEVC